MAACHPDVFAVGAEIHTPALGPATCCRISAASTLLAAAGSSAGRVRSAPHPGTGSGQMRQSWNCRISNASMLSMRPSPFTSAASGHGNAGISAAWNCRMNSASMRFPRDEPSEHSPRLVSEQLEAVLLSFPRH